jgi:hypothetical protein
MPNRQPPTCTPPTQPASQPATHHNRNKLLGGHSLIVDFGIDENRTLASKARSNKYQTLPTYFTFPFYRIAGSVWVHSRSIKRKFAQDKMVQIESLTTNAAGGAVLTSDTAERLVESLQAMCIEQVGSADWMRQHMKLQKLNLQAHHCVQADADNFVLEHAVTFEKLPLLVHELIVAEAWGEQIFPHISEALAKVAPIKVSDMPQLTSDDDSLQPTNVLINRIGLAISHRLCKL